MHSFLDTVYTLEHYYSQLLTYLLTGQGHKTGDRLLRSVEDRSQ